MDFQELRKEYETAGIDVESLAGCAIEQFRIWMAEAADHCPGRWFEANAMALATADSSGRISNRWVLLKEITDRGFKFYTNYESTKGQQLADNPNAAASFHWPYLGRQLRIEGVTRKTSREDSESYFHSRPRGSQFGALASRQSQPVAAREQLEQARTELESQVGDGPVPLPDDWGGYLLVPNRLEFWQGRLDRMHDRIVYRRDANGDNASAPEDWTIERLSP